jgi:hypothetical protein
MEGLKKQELMGGMLVSGCYWFLKLRKNIPEVETLKNLALARVGGVIGTGIGKQTRT